MLVITKFEVVAKKYKFKIGNFYKTFKNKKLKLN